MIFVFDVETTGLNPKHDRIIEFGGCAFDESGEVIGRVESLIYPGFSIPDEITGITGITDSMLLKAGVYFEEFADKALEWLSRAPCWGGQNLQFDLEFLSYEFERLGKELPQKDYADTLTIARRFLPAGRKNLGSLAKRYGVTLSNAHRAVADAEATGQILFQMAKELNMSLDDLVQGRAVALGPHALGQDPFDVMFAGL